MPSEVADEISAEGVESGDAAVNVEVAVLSGGECERAGADGFLEKEFFEGRGGLKHVLSIEDLAEC